MSERLGSRTEAEIEAALRDLSTAIEPPTPTIDVAATVRQRLEGARAPRRRPLIVWPFGRSLRLSLILAVVAALLIVALAAALGFGLPGLRIEITGPGPGTTPGLSPGPSAAAVELSDLGRPVAPAVLDEAAGFHVRRPVVTPVGTFVGTFVTEHAGQAIVNLAYASDTARPGTATVLITEFEASIDAGLFKKITDPATTIRPLHIGTAPGYWISGAPHELFFLDASGRTVSDTVRIVGDVLAWSQDGVTFRIEGLADLDAAIAIAVSMR